MRGPTLFMLLGAWLSACPGDDTQRRPPPGGDGDADADADSDADTDADGDADGDADADADADADGDGPLSCTEDSDCVVVVDLDQCCSCPLVMNTEAEAASTCDEPWPHDGEAPEGCGEGCEECPDTCNPPDEAACDQGLCTLVFPGDCRTSADCPADALCVEIEGRSVCQADDLQCAEHEQCAPNEWCAPVADGRECRRLDPGTCAWDGNCPNDPEDGQATCEGETDDQPGECVGP